MLGILADEEGLLLVRARALLPLLLQLHLRQPQLHLGRLRLVERRAPLLAALLPLRGQRVVPLAAMALDRFLERKALQMLPARPAPLLKKIPSIAPTPLFAESRGVLVIPSSLASFISCAVWVPFVNFQAISALLYCSSKAA